MAMLLTMKPLMNWLGGKQTASPLEQSFTTVIAEGKVRTYDVGGTASTLEDAKGVGARLA